MPARSGALPSLLPRRGPNIRREEPEDQRGRGGSHRYGGYRDGPPPGGGRPHGASELPAVLAPQDVAHPARPQARRLPPLQAILRPKAGPPLQGAQVLAREEQVPEEDARSCQGERREVLPYGAHERREGVELCDAAQERWGWGAGEEVSPPPHCPPEQGGQARCRPRFPVCHEGRRADGAGGGGVLELDERERAAGEGDGLAGGPRHVPQGEDCV
mmetsp:Transcript_65657/g.207726  ORF Transcript_65657/g.207726 Transcript_65657/m.207726 type:complete len:216 (-) Transcript_65657:842-1489(-)